MKLGSNTPLILGRYKTKDISTKASEGIAFNYLGTIGNKLISFAFFFLIIKFISVSEYGMYSILMSIATFFLTLSSLGLPATINRYLPEFFSKKEGGNFSKLAFFSLGICLLFSSVLIVLLFCYRDLLITKFHFPIELKSLLPLFSFVLLFFVENQLLGDAILNSLLEQRYTNISRITYLLLKLILVLFFLKSGLGVRGIVVGWLIAEASLFFIFCLRFLSIFKEMEESGTIENPFPITRVFRFGAYISLGPLNSFLLNIAADQFIIVYFLSKQAVGLYAFAMSIVNIVASLIPASIVFQIFQSAIIMKMSGTKDSNFLKKVSTFYLKVIIFVGVPIFTIVVIMADKVIPTIFKPEYLSALNVLYIYTPFMFIWTLHYPLGLIRMVKERAEITLYISIFTIYNLVADVLLIPHLGIEWAALATGSTQLFIFLLLLGKFHQDIKFDSISALKVIINISLPAVFLFALKIYVTSIFYLLFIMGLAGVIYLIASYFNSPFCESDIKVSRVILGERATKFFCWGQ